MELLDAVGLVDVDAIYCDVSRETPPDRPYVIVNMVTSIDGGTSLDGRSRGLTSPGDRAVFHTLRRIADAVLVAAGTVRAEGYGPIRLDDDIRAARVDRGQTAVPRIVIASRSLALDFKAPLFTEASSDVATTIIAPADVDQERLAAARDVGQVFLVGQGALSIPAALGLLRQRLGIETLLCEGGPLVNAQLAQANLIDELCVTIAPAIIGGDSRRLFDAAHLVETCPLSLAHVLRDDNHLLLRYMRQHQ